MASNMPSNMRMASPALQRDQSLSSNLTNQTSNEPQTEEQAWRHCLMGRHTFQEAKRLLESRADPNCRLKYKLGPKEFEGTPLTLAVKLDKPSIVRLLFSHKADPESRYQMRAGRSGVLWNGPAVCATVAKGNLSMMRLLVEYEANLSGRLIKFNEEPNVTLLYDASYFGHSHLVRFLLHQKGEPDLLVKFQDDMSVTKTALQVAASLGHDDVVRVLLGAKAQICPADEHGGPYELREAIDGCHVEVVRLLVEGGADLFGGEEGRRGVDYLFDTNNMVLIAAAAKGLRKCDEDLVDNVSIRDFVRFLATPDAEEILSAVFRNCDLRYWKKEKRVIWKTAYIPYGEMNVSTGPRKDHFDEKFHREMERASGDQVVAHYTDKELEQRDETFLCQLLPHRFEKLENISQVPVSIYHCLLPGLHRNPEVLWVLASGVNDRVFDERGARAIINLAWQEASRHQVITFLLDLSVAVLYWGLAFLLNDRRLQDAAALRAVVLVVLNMIWCRSCFLEVLQCMGFHAYGRLWDYLCSYENLLDAIRILLTGFSQIALLTNWADFGSNQVLRVIFALTGFVRWLRVLNTLKGFESTGKPMLPILQAVPATVPFFFVVFCWFSGFMHMYYSFGLTEWWTAGMIMYRLGFLADFSRNEMAPVDVDETWELWVDVVLVFMGLSMSIILMNILIGVLAESYNRGWEHRERLFLLERSRLVLQHFTTSAGWKRCCCICKRRVHGEEDDSYVWFVYPKDPSSWGEITSEYDQDAMNVHEKVTELRREIREMHEKLVERQHQESHERGFGNASFVPCASEVC
ncbi:unnamed protein product [Effrenium voratum]|nr:unnamed protein product [Effrenium voratum]